MRLPAVLALVALVLACAPPQTPDSAEDSEKACERGHAGACERAMLAAEPERIGGLLEAYVAAGGDPAWRALRRALDAGREPALVQSGGGAAPKGVDTIAHAARPLSVPADELVLAIARATKRRHVFLRGEAGMRQLFPHDVLATHTLGLPAIVAADPGRLPREIAVAASLRGAIAAARAFDYVGAARQIERLRELSDASRSEGALRARYALNLLSNAGIALSRRTDEPATPALPPAASSPYADYLAVELSTDRPAEWKKRRARIVARLPKARAAFADHAHAPPESCPAPMAVPVGAVADMAFAGWLPQSLDAAAAPGQRPAAGKLGLEDWLARYETLVRLVERTKSTWAFSTHLLWQRGELAGLTAEGSDTYARVTRLALAHVKGLDALAKAEPARFSALGAVALAYQPGVLNDRQLLPAVTRLVDTSVRRKIAAAADVAAVFDAGLAAFAAATSMPAPLQGPQLQALGEALTNKLAGPLSQARGWRVAALHAGDALLSWTRGQPAGIGKAAPRLSQALDGDIPYPALGRLVAAAAGYAAVAAEGRLDPAVANPAMHPPERAKAREALRGAIFALSDEGPSSPPERELGGRLVELADGLVATVAAELGKDETAPACDGEKPDLGDAHDRVDKIRRRVLASAAFERGEGTWVKRARLLTLVLSDALDLSADGDVAFAIDEAAAERIVEAALDGWLEPDLEAVVSGGYLLARGALGKKEGERRELVRHAARALTGLSQLFGEERSSLVAALGELGARAAAAGTGGLGEALAGFAERAYKKGALEQGDVLLLLALGASIVQDEPVAEAAVALARKRERPVHLALVLYGKSARDGGDPAAIVAAMQRAVHGSCTPLDVGPVAAVRTAIHDFRHGRRPKALESLAGVVATAERRGLMVPRQTYQYQQKTGDKAFSLTQSISLGGDLLQGSGTLQVGLGIQKGGERGGHLEIRFADPESAAAKREAGRYFAQVATILAVYQFAEGHPDRAVETAQRAVGAWANGVRLGDDRIPAETADWTSDAPGILAVAAQQAAEAGEALLAGDLWTLVHTALGPDANDEEVTASLEPLPLPLRDVPELVPVAARAARSLETLAAKLRCTRRPGRAAELERVGCEDYPLALSLRVADGLTKLPRLKPGSESGKPGCRAWRSLDDFLAAADQRRYEPDLFIAAIGALQQAGRNNDAATLLARQRHVSHCTPTVVKAARELGRREAIGVHLRADLLSIAANCDAQRADVASDLELLDELTQRHAMPMRNFEVLVFASRLALELDRWQPLAAISQKKGFVRRWIELGPDLAAAALLIHHASAIGSGKPIDAASTLPYYRLLCTSFPAKARGSMCNALALLRGEGTVSDKKRAAKKALDEFVQQGTAALRPPTP